MPELSSNLKFIRDNHESLFTILLYDKSKEEFLSDLKRRLEKVKDIKNTFKRKKLNDRIFNLVTQIESSVHQVFNHIILVSDDINYIQLTKKDIGVLKEYSIPNYTFEYGEYFQIDWLQDLFENFTFYDVVIYNSNQYTHYNGNLYKKKKISQTSNQDYVKNLQCNFYLIGKINGLKPIKNLIEHVNSNLSWNEIMELIRKNLIKKNVLVLENVLIDICKNDSKYIFGDQIYEQIENYNVKELFLHSDKAKQFNNDLIGKNLTNNINFNIISIETLETDGKNSTSSKLLNDFGGFIGVKHFAY